MLFMNCGGFRIEAMANGKNYNFEPFEEKEVWESDHILILTKPRYFEQGLVPVNYNEANQKKYPTYEAYKKARKLEGLKKLLETRKAFWVAERQAQVDVTHGKDGLPGTEADKAIINPGRFEGAIQAVEEWIAEALADKEDESKKRGRARMSGPSDSQNQVAA